MTINEAINIQKKTSFGSPKSKISDDWKFSMTNWKTHESITVKSEKLLAEEFVNTANFFEGVESGKISIIDSSIQIDGTSNLVLTSVGLIPYNDFCEAEEFLDVEAEKISNKLNKLELYIDKNGSIIRYLGFDDKMKEKVEEIRLSPKQIKNLFRFRDIDGDHLTEYMRLYIKDVILKSKITKYKTPIVSEWKSFSWNGYEGFETLSDSEFSEFKDLIKEHVC